MKEFREDLENFCDSWIIKIEGIEKESTSWKDFQRLDRLEYKKDQLSQLLVEME